MSALETTFARLSNEALRQIVADDAKHCEPHRCWATLEGYTARLILGRRRTWGFLERFDGAMAGPEVR